MKENHKSITVLIMGCHFQWLVAPSTVLQKHLVCRGAKQFITLPRPGRWRGGVYAAAATAVWQNIGDSLIPAERWRSAHPRPKMETRERRECMYGNMNDDFVVEICAHINIAQSANSNINECFFFFCLPFLIPQYLIQMICFSLIDQSDLFLNTYASLYCCK